MEKVHPWCGQPSDRGRLKIRSDQIEGAVVIVMSRTVLIFGLIVIVVLIFEV